MTAFIAFLDAASPYVAGFALAALFVAGLHVLLSGRSEPYQGWAFTCTRCGWESAMPGGVIPPHCCTNDLTAIADALGVINDHTGGTP